MGSECSGPRKQVYDISKSKRTRRTATLYLTTAEEDNSAAACSRGSDHDHTTNGNDDQTCHQHQISEKEEQKDDHVKLKQLINVEHNNKAADLDSKADEKDEGRALLGEYFADEKQLQMVVKQPEDGSQGVKLKRVFKRYVKALGQMVKSKRNQRLDRPTLRLPM